MSIHKASPTAGKRQSPGARARRMAGVLALAAAMIPALGSGSAQAAFGDGFQVDAFDGAVSNQDGTPFTQAGGHPYAASTTIDLRTTIDADGVSIPEGDAKNFRVDLPPGFIGNPAVVSTCTEGELAVGGFDAVVLPLPCPATSQIGVVRIDLAYQFGRVTLPVFNMPAPPGYPAQFGFNVMGQGVVHLLPSVRSDGDYGLTVDIANITQTLPILSTTLTLWGVPADPSHDTQRGQVCALGGATCFNGNVSANTPPKAFLTNPSDCTAGPLTTLLTAQSWQRPDVSVSASFVSHDSGTPPLPLGVTGCERLPFNPAVDIRPMTATPDAPTGLSVNLAFATEGLLNPDGIATAPLKNAKVTLPDGMTINPAAADGLTACGDADLNVGKGEAVRCPDSSKVGTAQATTPLLNEPLSGSIYIRPQISNDPASGQMFRIALVLENIERGMSFRLPGQIRVDPATGQVVTEFDNNPQLPVANLSLRFKSGPRATLATPSTCGTKAVEADLTSWAGQSVHRSSSFTINCTPGLGGFTPSLTAGTAKPVGGTFSPFNLQITKPDGNAPITGLSMTLPTGLLASLKGNVGTQVGTAKAFTGPGSNPFMLPGQVFLAGRYGDAPFSLKVVVPAKAGPFDLGTVTVRQKVYVDPIDAHVTVVSDPLPTIVSGVPVRLQRLDISIDKAGFIINPTSCAAKAIGGTMNAAGGQTAPINVRFQARACNDLALKPSLALTLSGKGQTTDGKHPAVSAALTQPAGQANLKKVRVTLPLSLALDPDNSASDALCSFVEGSKVDPKCPDSSIVGKATAVSPILNEPLSGPVFFVKNERKDPKSGRSIKTTPKLVIPLVGENGVKLTLTGASDVVDDRLVTTFDNIPDAQVSSFKMDIAGGKKGILVVSDADICKSTQIADQEVDGQNNKAADGDVFIQTPSCPLKVMSKKVGKSSVTVKVGGLGAGKVTVTGHGIKKTTKTITKSTVATITAKRTKGKPGKVTVSYDPTGPAKARKTTK